MGNRKQCCARIVCVVVRAICHLTKKIWSNFVPELVSRLLKLKAAANKCAVGHGALADRDADINIRSEERLNGVE